MTTTSALLGWMDPSTSSPPLPPSPRVFLPMARAAVDLHGGPADLPWSTVEVLAGPAQTEAPSDTSPTFLAATSGDGIDAQETEPDCHFRVDLHGIPSPTSHWVEQRSLPGTLETVRIQIARRNNDERMTRAQWFCVRALATALNELDHPAEDAQIAPHSPDERLLTAVLQEKAVPLRMHESWGRIYELPHETAQ